MNQELGRLIRAMMRSPRDERALEDLDQHLREHPADYQQYLEYCRLHGDLYFLVRSQDAERRTLDQLGTSCLMPLPAPGDLADVVNAPASAANGARRKNVFRLLCLAASVAVAFGWYSYFNRWQLRQALRQPTIVANIVSVENAVWNGSHCTVGQSLRIGTELRLAGGLIKVNMPTGAELLLQGPCDVFFEAPDHVFLKEGKLTAHVAQWANGFEVETSSFKLFDLGTEFAVEADNLGGAEAHVLEGHVRIQPFASSDKSRTSFLLAKGEAIRMNPFNRTTTRLAAQQDRFVTSFGEFRPYRPIKIFNTGQDLTIGDEDPHWRILSGAVGEGYKGPQYAVVCTPDERYLANNPEVSQWMSVAKDLRPGCLPNASYTFATEFDLSEYDLSTVVILADILADNGVGAVRINGTPVDLVPWRDNEYLQEFHTFRRAEIVDGFLPGKNVIEIDVWNGIYHFDSDKNHSVPTPNPMSIRVEWQAFGIPLGDARKREGTI